MLQIKYKTGSGDIITTKAEKLESMRNGFATFAKSDVHSTMLPVSAIVEIVEVWK